MEIRPVSIIPNPMTIEKLILLEYSYDTTEFVLISLPKLKTIDIGSGSFGVTRTFRLENLKELQSIMIGANSFVARGLHSLLRIANCKSLISIQFSDRSFSDYQSIELRGLPSLQSIVMGESCFSSTHILSLSGPYCFLASWIGLPKLQSLHLGNMAFSECQSIILDS